MNDVDDHEDLKKEHEHFHDKRKDEEHRQKQQESELQTEKWALESSLDPDQQADLIISDMRAKIAALEEEEKEEERKKAQSEVEKAEAILTEMDKDKKYILKKIMECSLPTFTKKQLHKILVNIDLRHPGALLDLISLRQEIGALTTPHSIRTEVPRRPRRMSRNINLVQLRLNRRKRTWKLEIDNIESRFRHLINNKLLYDDLRI